MATKPQRGEIQQMQQDIANEIKRDAPSIANGVFGNNALHPDMATVSNQELDQLYLNAYQRNDRQWLMAEAQRDPRQFLQVTDRIGVPDPPVGIDGKPIPPQAQQDAVASAFQQQAQQNAVQAAPLPSPGAAAPPGIGPAPVAAPMPAALPAPGPQPVQMPLPIPGIQPGTL